MIGTDKDLKLKKRIGVLNYLAQRQALICIGEKIPKQKKPRRKHRLFFVFSV